MELILKWIYYKHPAEGFLSVQNQENGHGDEELQKWEPSMTLAMHPDSSELVAAEKSFTQSTSCKAPEKQMKLVRIKMLLTHD